MDKKKAKRNMELTGINVLNLSHTYVTRKAEEDQWDRDDTATTNHIVGIKKSGYEYGDVQVAFEVKKNVPYYLVYAVYSTGDSFGHDSGVVEYIDLFQLKEAAEGCRRAALDTGSEYSFKYMNEFLEFITHSKAWTGYFESLEDIYIEEVFLET